MDPSERPFSRHVKPLPATVQALVVSCSHWMETLQPWVDGRELGEDAGRDDRQQGMGDAIQANPLS